MNLEQKWTMATPTSTCERAGCNYKKSVTIKKRTDLELGKVAKFLSERQVLTGQRNYMKLKCIYPPDEQSYLHRK